MDILSQVAALQPKKYTARPAMYKNSQPAQLYAAMGDGEVWTTARAREVFGWTNGNTTIALKSLLRRGYIHKVGEERCGPNTRYLYMRNGK